MISPNVRDFMNGDVKLSELSAKEIADGVKGFESAANKAKSAADKAYQNARAGALKGQNEPPGKLLVFRKNFIEKGGE